MKNLKEEIQSVIDIYKAGDFTKADSICKKLIIQNPKLVFLYNLSGLILTAQNNIDAAINIYEKGIKIDPNFAMIYNNLGLLYEFRKKNKEAEEQYKKSISLDKSIAEPHNNLGKLFFSLGKYSDALNSYKHALNINSKLPYVHHNLATLYISFGEFSKAKSHLKEAIKIQPNLIHAHRSLSRITKYKVDDEHLNQLNELYKELNLKDEINRMYLAFSLGKAYEDIMNFDKSFSYYKEANIIYKNKINFSINEEKKKFEDIKKIYNQDIFNKYKDHGFKDKSPIFILGLPRSGTTLVEQILSSHPLVFGADEIELIPNLNNKYIKNKNSIKSETLESIGKEYVEKIKKISDNSERTTDKYPANFLLIGLIKLALPNSKIIHCCRNAEDTCFSIFKNHFTSDKIKYAYNIDDIVEYYNLYSDLMNHWKDTLNNFIFDINYEKLISNTEFEVKKLLKFCDLNWNSSCLDFYKNKRPIKTASDVQVREKIYLSSVNSWKNYSKFLNSNFSKIKIR
tara:strand:- start:806 stop:2341 length:1536 start_codon:yes stop_codon:yes gene_type:complete